MAIGAKDRGVLGIGDGMIGRSRIWLDRVRYGWVCAARKGRERYPRYLR